MKALRKALVATAALASSYVPSPAEAQDRNQAIMKALYSKLENQLGATQSADGFGEGTFVMAAPGFILDPQLDPSTPTGQMRLFNLIDSTISPGWILRFSGNSTSGIYNQILTHHLAAPASLTAAEKQKLSDAQHILYAPGPNNPWSKVYLELDAAKTKYYAAQDDLNDWQTAHPDQEPPNSLILKVDQTHNAYFNDPNYSKVIAALDTVTVLGARDPAVFWGQAQGRNTAGTLLIGGQSVPKYDFDKPYKSWFDKTRNWTTITLADSDVDTVNTSSHASWGGGLSGGWGLWSGGGSFGKTIASTLHSLNTQTFNLSFEVNRVRVYRPWMEPLVFGSRAWKWDSGAPNPSLISSGENVDGSVPTGLEPLVVQEIILARNVSLTGTWGTDLATTYHSESHANGHVGWGPFSFGADSSNSYDEAKDHNQVTSNGITSPDVQIIGYLVSIRPKTPDPDPALFGGGGVTVGTVLLGGKVPSNNMKLPSQVDRQYLQSYRNSMEAIKALKSKAARSPKD